MNQFTNNQGGYIALIAVLIIVVVTLSIGISLNSISIGETQSGLLKQQSAQSLAIADSCLQEAYLRIERESDYPGGSLNIGQGSCTINIVPAGSDRTITVTSDVNDIIKSAESGVTITSGNVVVNYWTELN